MKHFTISACLLFACLPLACTQAATNIEEETTATTSQAVQQTKEKTEPLFCADCFEETAGGGAGTPNGIGSNGFVGGVAGYASGAATRIKPADTPCVPDPGTECVNVRGEARPLEDSKIRVTIIGKEEGNRVEVDLPIGRGYPNRMDPPPLDCGQKTQEEGQCLDMYKMCMEAAETADLFQQFISHFFWLIGGLNAARMQTAVFRKIEVRQNMCWAVFGTKE